MKPNGYVEFLAFFEELPDPPRDRGPNDLLIDLVPLALCSPNRSEDSGANIESFSLAHQAWFAKFQELPNKG